MGEAKGLSEAMTHSQISAGLMKQRDARVQTSGFAKAVRRYVKDEDYLTDEPNDEIDVPVRPDAFMVDADNRVITVYEIEDTNALSVLKIHELADLWFAMDAFSWDLKVVVTDRYGMNHRELDMQKYWYYFLANSSRALNFEAVA